MSNPYEPPAARDPETSTPETGRQTFGLVVQLLVVSIGIAGIAQFASLPARDDPYVVLTGPFWYLKIASDPVGGIALAAFCLTGFASVCIWPRWYTALFAALAALVWFGTSFYLLARMSLG